MIIQIVPYEDTPLMDKTGGGLIHGDGELRFNSPQIMNPRGRWVSNPDSLQKWHYMPLKWVCWGISMQGGKRKNKIIFVRDWDSKFNFK